MLAIPVDIEHLNAKSSLLFGNVKDFAIYYEKEKRFEFKKNPGCGNGIKTAEALKSWDVEKVVYSYLGDGPFNTMINNGMDVYHVGKSSMSLYDIVNGLNENKFVQVDNTNASDYLDPGTNSGSCECGCSHD